MHLWGFCCVNGSTGPFATHAPIPPQIGSSPVALATFLQLLRSTTLQERRAQRLYRTEVLRIAARVRGIFDEWLLLREVEPDNAQLANAAAVNRWELMRLLKAAGGLEPPRSLSGIHRDVAH